MELDALTQVEGVLQAIVGHFVALSQSGSQGAVGLQTQQAVVDVGQNQVVSAGAALLGLSEEPVGLIGRCQDSGVLLGGSGNCADGEHHQSYQQQYSNLFHNILLLCCFLGGFAPWMTSVYHCETNLSTFACFYETFFHLLSIFSLFHLKC